jgi:hypothetical protein
MIQTIEDSEFGGVPFNDTAAQLESALGQEVMNAVP